ncbi:MAG: hypothetical protein H6744_05045 [Deltaproteobacteria bacterium]|nr:hypothetical protein [Deltaproteobacteria bacterium]MCB9786044.1 hypothetical protein [Deltaproteobacteria bacterium]
MTTKQCPKCGQTWRDGNFCPTDGTKLQDVAARPSPDAETAPQPTARGAAAGADDNDATVLETAAVPASLAAEWLAAHRAAAALKAEEATTAPDGPARPAAPASRPAAPASRPPASRPVGPRDDPDSQRTRLEVQAIPMSAAQRGQRARPAPAQPPKKQLGDTALERIAQKIKGDVAKERPDARGATVDAGAVRPSAKAAPAQRGANRPSAPASGGQEPPSDQFSETQWFLKGLEVDADLLEIVDEKEYKRNSSIPEAERRRMTLRDKDEDQS